MSKIKLGFYTEDVLRATFIAECDNQNVSMQQVFTAVMTSFVEGEVFVKGKKLGFADGPRETSHAKPGRPPKVKEELPIIEKPKVKFSNPSIVYADPKHDKKGVLLPPVDWDHDNMNVTDYPPMPQTHQGVVYSGGLLKPDTYGKICDETYEGMLATDYTHERIKTTLRMWEVEGCNQYLARIATKFLLINKIDNLRFDLDYLQSFKLKFMEDMETCVEAHFQHLDKEYV